jgi:hypothetical protein
LFHAAHASVVFGTVNPMPAEMPPIFILLAIATSRMGNSQMGRGVVQCCSARRIGLNVAARNFVAAFGAALAALHGADKPAFKAGTVVSHL